MTFLLKNLILLHKGTLALQLKSAFVLSLAISPLLYIGERMFTWYVTNQDYIYVVLGAIVVDNILGSCHHAFIVKDFTWKKNIIGISIKVGLVVAVGFLFEGLHVITKQDSILKDYLVIVTRLSVFLYPAGSAFMNSAELTGGVFPPVGWIKKIQSFNQSLKLPNQESDQNKEE